MRYSSYVVRIVLALFLFTAASIAQSPGPDPTPPIPSQNWVPGPNGHFYALSTIKGTWLEVEAQAVAEGGHLVAIRNKAENDFLVQTFLVGQVFCDTLPTAGPWIGLTDAEEEGVFTWVSGEPVRFTNWLEGQPDNHGRTPAGEDYVQFFSDPTINEQTGDPVGAVGGADGTWNDQTFQRETHCGSALPGIIEVPSLQVPPFTPTAAACQKVIGQASFQLMRTVQQQHARCLNQEAAGGRACNIGGRDDAITQAANAARDTLDTTCTLDAYRELHYFGDTAQAVRNGIIQDTINTTAFLIRQTYPAAYANKP
jgi:hypothetical protein